MRETLEKVFRQKTIKLLRIMQKDIFEEYLTKHTAKEWNILQKRIPDYRIAASRTHYLQRRPHPVTADT